MSFLASKHHRRPFFLWVLVIGLLCYALINGLRLYGALTAWEILAALQEKPGPLYLAISGGVFALLFTMAAAALLTGKSWGLWTVRLAALVYAAWYWADRLFISSAAERYTGWPFSLGLSAVLLGLVFSVTAVLAELWRPGAS